MNKQYRLIVIAESRKKPEIVHVEYFKAPYLNKKVMQECVDRVYNNASLDDWCVWAQLDDVTCKRYRRIVEIIGVTSCTIWPERISTTSIYINNKYVRTMGGKGE